MPKRHKKKQQSKPGKAAAKNAAKHKLPPLDSMNGKAPKSKREAIMNALSNAQQMTTTQLQQTHDDDDRDNHQHQQQKGSKKYQKHSQQQQQHQNHKNKHQHKNGGVWKSKSKKQSHWNRFLAQLRPQGLGLRNVGSDGNCLFRSIADQLSGDEHQQSEIRAQVIEYMRTHRDEFAPFIVSDYDAYLAKMSRTGIWGGNFELIAAAKTFAVDISIHSLEQARYEVLYQKGRPQRTIHLSYHNERHYASVRKLDDLQSGRGRPAACIDLDSCEQQRVQRERQRAEIAYTHNGGNPLHVEHAKQDGVFETWSAAEQMVVQRSGCYDIERVRNALALLQDDVEAAVESVEVEMSLMAVENQKKLQAELEQQKREQLEKKKKKNKKSKLKEEKEEDASESKVEVEEDTKQSEEMMMAMTSNNDDEAGDNDHANVNVMTMQSGAADDVDGDVDEMAQRLSKLKQSKLKSEAEDTKELEAKSVLLQAGDVFAVKVSIIADHDTDETKEKASDDIVAMMNDHVHDGTAASTTCTAASVKSSTATFKCIACDFESAVLFRYLRHYKKAHSNSNMHVSASIEDVECPFGHRNESQFGFCCECGWDMRLKPVLPEIVKTELQESVDPQPPESPPAKVAQPTVSTTSATSQAMTTKPRPRPSIKWNHKQRPQANSDAKYRKYLKAYWICAHCTFWNPNTNAKCMVCWMLTSTQPKAKAKSKATTSNIVPSSTISPPPPSAGPAAPPPPPQQQQKSNAFAWICAKCTMENAPKHQKCFMCESDKSKNTKPKNKKPKNKNKNESSNKHVSSSSWVCVCTVTNDASATSCSVCGNFRETGESAYFAEPDYTDEAALQDELGSYGCRLSKSNSKSKSSHETNGSSGNGTSEKWSTAGGHKCPCGSGKKFKKCCKKLGKHQGTAAVGNDNWSSNVEHRSESVFGDTVVDDLTALIEQMEIEILNYKKKAGKQEKIKMMKELTKLKQQRDELANKRKRERNQMFKAQQQQKQDHAHDSNRKQSKKKQNKSQEPSPPPRNNAMSVNHVIAI